MTKAFSTTDTNSKALYDKLHQAGVQDQEMDGAQVQAKPVKGSGNGQPAVAEKDGKVGSKEVFAFVFTHFQKFGQTLKDHFKTLGLDVSWLQADGSISQAKSDALQKQLLGDGPRSLQSVGKKHLSQATKNSGQGPIKQAEGALLKTVEEVPEFQLLAPKDQQKVLTGYLTKQGYTSEQIQKINSRLAKSPLLTPPKHKAMEKKVAIAAFVEAQKLRSKAVNLNQRGNTAEGQKVLTQAKNLYLAAVEVDPSHWQARFDLAEIHLEAGEAQEARAQLQRGLENFQGQDVATQMQRVQGMLQSDAGTKLLKAGEGAQEFMGRALLKGGHAQEALNIFETALEEAKQSKNEAAEKKFQNLKNLAEEETEGGKFQLAFKGHNPLAESLYQELKAQGLASVGMDSGEGDRVITEKELFAFIGNHLSDKRVRHALKLAGMVLPKDAEAGIAKDGFANFMATHFVSEAKKNIGEAGKIKVGDPRRGTYLDKAKQQMTWAYQLDSGNLKVRKGIREVCGEFRKQIQLGDNEFPQAHHLENAKFLADFNAAIGDDTALAQDLQVWNHLLNILPDGVQTMDQQLDQYCQIMKHWSGMRARAQEEAKKPDPKFPADLSPMDIREKMKGTGLGLWSVAANSTLETKDAQQLLHQFIDRLTDGDEKELTKYLSPRGLQQFVLDTATTQLRQEFDPESNGTAVALHTALKAQGICDAVIDQQATGAGAKVLDAQDVFDYIGTNLKDPRVQAALKATGVPLPENLEQQVLEKGFGKAMADHLMTEADKIRTDEAKSKNIAPERYGWYDVSAENGEAAANLYMAAAQFDPKNPVRYDQLFDFFSERPHGKPAALNFLKAAIALDPTDARKNRMFAVTPDPLVLGDDVDKLMKAGKTDEALALVQEASMSLETIAETLPEKAGDIDFMGDLARVNSKMGELLEQQGKKSEAKKFRQRAVDQYQKAIDSEPTNPKGIRLYRLKADAQDAIGDYSGARASLIAGSRMQMLLVNHETEEFISKDPQFKEKLLDDRKNSRVVIKGETYTIQKVQDHMGHVGFALVSVEDTGRQFNINELGNYVLSDAHDIKDVDPYRDIPEWADIGLRKYDRHLQEKLEHNQSSRKAAEENPPPDLSVVTENIESEIKLLQVLGRDQEAKELESQAKQYRAELNLEQSMPEVEALAAAGKIDDEALFLYPWSKTGGTRGTENLSDYLQVTKEGGKSKLVFKDKFHELSLTKKQAVLDAAVKSGERMGLVRQLRQSKGEAKSFVEGKIAYFDGDFDKAQNKLQGFMAAAKGKTDPELQALMGEAQSLSQNIEKGTAKSEDVIMNDVKVLLGSLVPSQFQDAHGRLDTKKFNAEKFKTFGEFQEFLATQASVDGKSFNQVIFANYHSIIRNPKYEPLLKNLYAEINPEAAGEIQSTDKGRMNALYHEFNAEMAQVDFGRFASQHLQTVEGRKKLRRMLDPNQPESRHYDKDFRADLLEELIDAADVQGHVPHLLRARFERQLSTYMVDLNVTHESVRKATDIVLQILDIADHSEAARSKHHEKYLKHPEEIPILQGGGLNQEITPQRLREVAQLYADLRGSPDGRSQMQAKLANMWLLVADNENWTYENNNQPVSAEKRAYMINRLEDFMARAGKVQTNQEMIDFNNEIHDFLNGSSRRVTDLEGDQAVNALKDFQRDATKYVLGESITIGEGVNDLFEGMVGAPQEQFNDLYRFSEEIWATTAMGYSVDVLDPELRVQDPKLRENVADVIHGLRSMKRGLCASYKGNGWFYKMTKGHLDKMSIDDAQKKIDGLIMGLQNAKNPEEVRALIQEMTDSFNSGGALHEARVATDNSAWKVSLDFLQIAAEIILTEVVTAGAGTGMAIARASAAAGRYALATKSFAAGIQVYRNTRNAQRAMKLIGAVQKAGRLGQVRQALGLAKRARDTAAIGETAEGVARLNRLALEAAKAGKASQATRLFQAAERMEQAALKTEMALAGSMETVKNSRHLAKLAEQGDLHAKSQLYAARMIQGGAVGFKMQLTGNLMGAATGQLRGQPFEIEDILKQALATSASMAITGPFEHWTLFSRQAAGVSKALANRPLMTRLYQDYLKKGVLNIPKKVMAYPPVVFKEVVEEVIDAYIIKYLDGDPLKLSHEEFTELIKACAAGQGIGEGRAMVGTATGVFLPSGRRQGRSTPDTDTSEATAPQLPPQPKVGSPYRTPGVVEADGEGKFSEWNDLASEPQAPPPEEIQAPKGGEPSGAMKMRAGEDLKAPQEPGLVKKTAGARSESPPSPPNLEQALIKGREILSAFGLPKEGELTAKKIKKASRQWMAANHPDKLNLDPQSPEGIQANAAMREVNALTSLLLKHEAGETLKDSDAQHAQAYLDGKMDLPRETSGVKVGGASPDTKSQGPADAKSAAPAALGTPGPAKSAQVPRPDVKTTAAQDERRQRIEAIQLGFAHGDRVLELDGEYRYQAADANEPSRPATREEIVASQEWEAPVWLTAEGKVLADSRGKPRALDFNRGRRPVIGSKGHLKLAGDGILAAHAKIERRGTGSQVQYVLHRAKGPDGKPAMVRMWNEGKGQWVPVPPKGMVIQGGMKFWVGSATAKVPHPNVWAAGEVDTGPHMPHGQVFGFAPQYGQVFREQVAEEVAAEFEAEIEAEEKTSADSQQGQQDEGGESQSETSPATEELVTGAREIADDIDAEINPHVPPELNKEVYFLAEGTTPFAEAAQDLMAGRITAEEYRSKQEAISDDLIEEHRAALSKIQGLLERAKKDGDLNIENIDARSKDAEKIIPKLVNRGWKSLKGFTDFGGARVIFNSFYNGDQFSTTAFLRKMKVVFGAEGIGIRAFYDGDGNEVRDDQGKPIKDWDQYSRFLMGHPKRGHRAIHVVVEYEGKPIEIQLMTSLQSEWGGLQHDFYKHRDGIAPQEVEAIDGFFKAAADFINDYEIGVRVTAADKPVIPALSPFTAKRFKELFKRTLTLVNDLLDKPIELTERQAALAPAKFADDDTKVDATIIDRNAGTQPGVRTDPDATRVSRLPGAPVSPEVFSKEESSTVRVIQFAPFVLGAKGIEAENLLEAYFRRNSEQYPDEASRQELLSSLENKQRIFTVDSDGILYLEDTSAVRQRRKVGLETFAQKLAPEFALLAPESQKLLLHGFALRLTRMGSLSESRVKEEVGKIGEEFIRLTREARVIPGRVYLELAFLYLSGQKNADDISSLARRYGHVVSTMAMWGLPDASNKLAKSFLSRAFSQDKNLHRYFEKSIAETEPILTILQTAIASLPPAEAKIQRQALVTQVFQKQIPITRALEIAATLTLGRAIEDTGPFHQALLPKLREYVDRTRESDRDTRRSITLNAQIDIKRLEAKKLREESAELDQKVAAGIEAHRSSLEEEVQAIEVRYQERHQELISAKVVFDLVLQSQVPILIDNLNKQIEKLTQGLQSDQPGTGTDKEITFMDPDLEVKSIRLPEVIKDPQALAEEIQDLKSVVSQLEQARSLETSALYNLMIAHVPTRLFSDIMDKRFEIERFERQTKAADAELARVKKRAHRSDEALQQDLEQLAHQAQTLRDEADHLIEETEQMTRELAALNVDRQTREAGNLHVRIHNILARHQKNPKKSLLIEELSAHFFDANLPIRKMVALSQALGGLSVEQQAQLVFDYLVAYETLTDSATTTVTSSTRPEGQKAASPSDDQTRADGQRVPHASATTASTSLEPPQTPNQLMDQLLAKAQALVPRQGAEPSVGRGSPEAGSASQAADLMGRGSAYAIGTPALVATLGMAQGVDSATTATLALLSAALTPVMGMAFSWVSNLFTRETLETPKYPTEDDPLIVEDEGYEFMMYRFGHEQLAGRKVLPGDIGQIRPENVELQPGSRKISVYFTRRGLDPNNQIIENKPVLLVTLNEAQANRLGIFIDPDGLGLNTDQLIEDEIFIMGTKDAPREAEQSKAALQFEDYIPPPEKTADQNLDWIPAFGGEGLKSQFDFYHPQQDGPLEDHPLHHVARVAKFEPLPEADRFEITVEIYDPTDPEVLPKEVSGQQELDFHPEAAQVLETRRYEVYASDLMGIGVPFFGPTTELNSLARHLFTIRDQGVKLDEKNPVVLFKDQEDHSLAIYRDKDLNPRKLPGIKLYHAQIDVDSVKWGDDGWVDMDFLSQIPGQEPTYIGSEEMRVEDARRLGLVRGRGDRVRLVADDNVFLIGSINASQDARAHFDPQLRDPKRRYAFAQALVDRYDSDAGQQSLDPTWIESAKKYIEAFEKAQEKGEVFAGRTREPAFIQNLDAIRRSYALEMHPFGTHSEKAPYQLGFYDPRWGIDTHGAQIYQVERVSDSGLIMLRDDAGQEKAITTGSMFKKHPFQEGDLVRLYDLHSTNFEPIENFITDSWLPPSGAAFSAGGLGLLGLTFGTGWVAAAGLAAMAGGAALASFSFLLGYMAAKGKLQSAAANLIEDGKSTSDAPPSSGVFNRDTQDEITLPGVLSPEQLGRETLNKNGVMYSVGAPAGIFMGLSAQGISPGWSFLAAAASALFSSSLLGMVWQGKKAHGAVNAIPLRPPPGKNQFTLGRGHNVDVLLDSTSVSREHATFYRGEDGQWYVRDGVGDKPSSNGIAMAGPQGGARKLAPGTWHPVNEGDVLQIGDQQLVFRAPVQSEAISETFLGVARKYFLDMLAQDPINFDITKLTQQEAAVPPNQGDRYKLAQAMLHLISQNYHMECDFSGLVSHEARTTSGQSYLLQPPSQKHEILPGFREARVLGGSRVGQTIHMVVDTGGGMQETLSLPFALAAPFKINLNSKNEVIFDPAPRLWIKSLEVEPADANRAALRQVPLKKAVPPPQAPTPQQQGIQYLNQLEGLLDQDWQTNPKGYPTDPNWKDHRDYRGGVALIAHAGGGKKYSGYCEDRTDFVKLSDGRTVSIALDGMGGHGGGEMAATIAQKVFRMALQDGHPLETALQMADHAIAEHNQRMGRVKRAPGATAVLVEMTPTGPGTYRGRFAKVADADALVIRPSLLGTGDAIIDWTETTHYLTPQFSGMDPGRFQGGPGGRMPRRMTLYNRLNPRGNIIETSLGGGKVKPHFFAGQKEFHDGDIIISGSDGLHESFLNKDRIQEVVARALHANPGKNTAKVVADALRQESLIRMWLCAHKREDNDFLTHESYVEAYRAVMAEEPPVDFRGMYEPFQDAQGNWVRFRLNKSGEIERVTAAHPQGELFDSFGDDNLSITVQVLGQETGSLRPDWPGLSAEHRVDPNHLQALSRLNMRERTREQLNDSQGLGVAPVTRVDVGSHQFYLSRVIQEQDSEGKLRKFVLALVPVQEEGGWTLKRRFFVKHQSDQGSWRASPYQIGGHIAKGLGRHYTQETQIAPEIMDRLHELESAQNPSDLDYRTLSEDQLGRYIDVSALDEELTGAAVSQVQSMVGGFGKEVQVAAPQGLTVIGGLQPGKVFKGNENIWAGMGQQDQDLIGQLENLALPAGFLPKFDFRPPQQGGNLIRSYKMFGEITGEITCHEFSGGHVKDKTTGRIRPVIWTMAEDSQGRTWVKGIRYQDVKVSSYGTFEEVLDSGVLTSKPLEYFQQATALYKYGKGYVLNLLGEDGRSHPKYVDISPTLGLLEPVKRYREARGLAPIYPAHHQSEAQVQVEDSQLDASLPPAQAVPGIPGLAHFKDRMYEFKLPGGTQELYLKTLFPQNNAVSGINGHGVIYRKGGRVWIRDNGSTNGTQVFRGDNFEKPIYQHHQRGVNGQVFPLERGDWVLIGGEWIRIDWED